MNIDEKLEREYIFEYNTNKNMLSKEQKITIYNVLELEKEQKLNEIVKVEDLEIGFMSMSTSIIVIFIYMSTLVNDVFGMSKIVSIGYFFIAMASMLLCLISVKKNIKKIRKERELVENNNKDMHEEIIKISTKQAVIKRLLLEEDGMNI